MFRKLLRHDMRAIGKFWWIAALVSTVLSVLGGFCISILRVDYTSYTYLQSLSVFGIILVVMAYGAFSIISMVLIFVRFYKNFFSDEGYLTFTLPVRRVDLLNSKLVASVIYELLTVLTIGINVIGMLCIGFADEIFTKSFFRGLRDVIKEIFEIFGGYVAVYSVEAIIAVILMSVFSFMGIFICITLAATITKKHKVLTALGFYYAYSAIVSGLMQTVMFNGAFVRIMEMLAELNESEIKFALSIIFLGIIALVAAACAALHILEHYLLRKRLNLD